MSLGARARDDTIARAAGQAASWRAHIMYQHLLIPIADDEDRGRADAAFEIARALSAPDAKLTILHVIETIPAFIESQIPESALEKGRRETDAMLEAVAARAPAGAKTDVVSGHAGRAILDYAERWGADCIVIGSHRPGVQDMFFGSTAAHVVRHAPCAVHVLR